MTEPLLHRRRVLWLGGTAATAAAVGIVRMASGPGRTTTRSPGVAAQGDATPDPAPAPSPDADPGATRSPSAQNSPSERVAPSPSPSEPPATEDPSPSDPDVTGATAEPSPDAASPGQPHDDGGGDAPASPPPDDTPTPDDAPMTGDPSDDPAASPRGARDVICRDALSIPAGTDQGRPHTPTGLMLHHTAVSSTSASQAPDRLRGHTRYHQQQGWPTIAYHYGVDLNGNLYELRDVNIAGDTFTSYDPAGWFLVVCEGDFNARQPTDRMLDGVAAMLTHGAATFGIDPATLAGHRDHASTTCPGDLLYAHRDALVSEVQRRLGAGAGALPRICDTEADERVARIEAGDS